MNTTPEIDAVARRAHEASAPLAASEPKTRARYLVAIADALQQHSDELVSLSMKETGLSNARLTFELSRTAVQLRLFADTVVDGSYLDVRIDEKDADYVLGVRPDLRRYLTAVGPVINFTASNFPFAFSVAGGDTASALAAGCPVIVKAHSGHPELSRRTAEIIVDTLATAGAHEGVFQLVEGQEAGVALLKDSRVKAASFTGSLYAGRLLADVAASRPDPIPFYGELGSVNPVIITSAAIAERAQELAAGLAASVAGSAGQLCTKPGFVFVPKGHGLEETMRSELQKVEEHRLLNEKITRSYNERREEILGTKVTDSVFDGSLRIDDESHGWATPTIVSVSAAVLFERRKELLEEAFGPLSVLVEYDDIEQLDTIYSELFTGNLTATLHIAQCETGEALERLTSLLAKTSGRVLFNGWPTGVAVTYAQQHGGPWPATTNDSSTSVGTAAISRFLRPVAYQDAPQAYLPAPLRDDNPWGVPQRRSAAGGSHEWGSLVSRE